MRREDKSLHLKDKSSPLKVKTNSGYVNLTTTLKQLSLACALTDDAKPSGQTFHTLTSKKPVRLRVGMRCQAQAPHHIPQTFIVPMKQNYQVILEPTGILSVRIHPPASRVWIDGQEIDNPSHRISLQGEDHLLLIRYRDQRGNKIEKSKELNIKAGDKVRLYLDMTRE